MANKDIYSDIAKRTGGDIYIGVVGPVRTGKSTFIHRFMETVVLPNITDEYDRARATDEMPQSAGGRTIMTTEPKFVPDEAVKISIEGNTELNVKLVDCVGYMVDGAIGDEEDGEKRMIMTPWSPTAIPFAEAAQIGTSKVISEHSTIGMLVTTDGSITDIGRESYIAAEERVVNELRELGKPFVILLNSRYPESDEAHETATELEEKYGVPVALVSCPDLSAEDIREILALVLGEFPVRELTFEVPSWCLALSEEHAVHRDLMDRVAAVATNVTRLGDVAQAAGEASAKIDSLDAGSGSGRLLLEVDEAKYYETVSELCGIDISDKRQMLQTVCDLAATKEKYDRVAEALADVESKGYGIVMPSPGEITLDEPQVVRQGAGFGVRVSAHADSIHMIRAQIRADVCPVVGTAEQSEEVAKYLSDEYEQSPEHIWESNMFGRSLHDLVKDGMNAKLQHLPDESRERLGDTLERVINEGAGGLLCILL